MTFFSTTTIPEDPTMRTLSLLSTPARLAVALMLACVLSACGGSDGGGSAPIIVPPTGTTPPPDTSVKPEMRCAP